MTGAQDSLFSLWVFEEKRRVSRGHGKPIRIGGVLLSTRLRYPFGSKPGRSLLNNRLRRIAGYAISWVPRHGYLLCQREPGTPAPLKPVTYFIYFTNCSSSVEPGRPVTGLSRVSNWASSVEPVSAVVEALPPATIWATSSK